MILNIQDKICFDLYKRIGGVKVANKIEVKCGVDTCHYWNNNFCHADKLEVNPQGNGKANSSDGTQCTTFRKA